MSSKEQKAVKDFPSITSVLIATGSVLFLSVIVYLGDLVARGYHTAILQQSFVREIEEASDISMVLIKPKYRVLHNKNREAETVLQTMISLLGQSDYVRALSVAPVLERYLNIDREKQDGLEAHLEKIVHSEQEVNKLEGALSKVKQGIRANRENYVRLKDRVEALLLGNKKALPSDLDPAYEDFFNQLEPPLNFYDEGVLLDLPKSEKLGNDGNTLPPLLARLSVHDRVPVNSQDRAPTEDELLFEEYNDCKQVGLRLRLEERGHREKYQTMSTDLEKERAIFDSTIASFNKQLKAIVVINYRPALGSITESVYEFVRKIALHYGKELPPYVLPADEKVVIVPTSPD